MKKRQARKNLGKREKMLKKRLDELSQHMLQELDRIGAQAVIMMAGAPCVVCGAKSTVVRQFVPAQPEQYGGVAGKIRIIQLPMCDDCTDQTRIDETYLPKIVAMHLAKNPQFDNRVPGGRGSTIEEVDLAFQFCMEYEVDDDYDGHDDQDVKPILQ